MFCRKARTTSVITEPQPHGTCQSTSASCSNGQNPNVVGPDFGESPSGRIELQGNGTLLEEVVLPHHLRGVPLGSSGVVRPSGVVDGYQPVHQNVKSATIGKISEGKDVSRLKDASGGGRGTVTLLVHIQDHPNLLRSCRCSSIVDLREAQLIMPIDGANGTFPPNPLFLSHTLRNNVDSPSILDDPSSSNDGVSDGDIMEFQLPASASVAAIEATNTIVPSPERATSTNLPLLVGDPWSRQNNRVSSAVPSLSFRTHSAQWK